MNIIYIEDKRRPERNEKYKEIISRLGYDNIIKFYDTTDPSIISNLTPDGVICHSGMEGYNIISYFAKLKGWPLLSYSGSVGSTPYLRKSKSNSNLFSVDSEYFESVLSEFISHCISLKGNHDE
ncbi:hypothetical protein [Vibrio alginolyticus]|uniref:hypothetical protein n=1 Tax=Vibrio alginolyticus TaxID=663 RepID=UPI00215ED9DD|nr:hypothetical protein [Vibrio alginolyticus]